MATSKAKRSAAAKRQHVQENEMLLRKLLLERQQRQGAREAQLQRKQQQLVREKLQNVRLLREKQPQNVRQLRRKNEDR